MSTFENAFDQVIGNEDGYSNHPHDLGGEGITRKANMRCPRPCSVSSGCSCSKSAAYASSVPTCHRRVRRSTGGPINNVHAGRAKGLASSMRA